MSILKNVRYFFTALNADTLGGLFGWLINLYGLATAYESKLFVPPHFVEFFQPIRQMTMIGAYTLTFSFAEFFTGRRMLGIGADDVYKQFLENQPRAARTEKNIAACTPPELVNNALPCLVEGFTKYVDHNLTVLPVVITPQPPASHIRHDDQICYVVYPNAVPKKINAEKLKQDKITNKQIGLLLKAGSLTLADGRTVYAADYQEKNKLIPVIVILSCPGPRYLPALVANATLSSYHLDRIQKDTMYVKLIVHITPQEVVAEKAYAEFVQRFGEQAEHVLCDQRIEELVPASQSKIVTKNFRHFALYELQHRYCPQFFPDFKEYDETQSARHRCCAHHPSPLKIEQLLSFAQSDRKWAAKRFFQYTLLPQQKSGYAQIKAVKLDAAEFNLSADFLQQVQQLALLPAHGDQPTPAVQTEGPPCKTGVPLKESPGFDPLIVFLGTASMKPGIYRNVSSVLLRCEGASLLLDCGEGTYSQIEEIMAARDFVREFLRIRLVVVTHFHEDHSIGLIQVLSQHRRLREQAALKDDQRLFVLLPLNAYVFFLHYERCIQDLGCRFVLTQQYLQPGAIAPAAIRAEFEQQSYADSGALGYEQLAAACRTSKQELDLLVAQDQLSLDLVPALHVEQSVSLVLRHKSGRHICYSGDTRPCPAFIERSADAALMIHEATFSDDMQQNAINNQHSTVLEAVRSAIQARCKHLVLTHFSQRYYNTDQILKNTVYAGQQKDFFDKNTAIAFDGLAFALSQAAQLPAITKCLQLLLHTKEEPGDEAPESHQQQL